MVGTGTTHSFLEEVEALPEKKSQVLRRSRTGTEYTTVGRSVLTLVGETPLLFVGTGNGAMSESKRPNNFTEMTSFEGDATILSLYVCFHPTSLIAPPPRVVLIVNCNSHYLLHFPPFTAH
jgi:hypothetical protein